MNLSVFLTPSRRLWVAVVGAILLLLVYLQLTGFWQPPAGSSLLYGQLADTRSVIESRGEHSPGLVAHAKVRINSLKPQTTYTDDQGQFWFKGLRDVVYQCR